jgi:hypothetical protein
MEPTQTISWPLLKKHLASLMERARSKMDEADGIEVPRLQGELQLLKRLQNLPETLALLDQEDRRVAELEKGR